MEEFVFEFGIKEEKHLTDIKGCLKETPMGVSYMGDFKKDLFFFEMNEDELNQFKEVNKTLSTIAQWSYVSAIVQTTRKLKTKVISYLRVTVIKNHIEDLNRLEKGIQELELMELSSSNKRTVKELKELFHEKKEKEEAKEELYQEGIKILREGGFKAFKSIDLREIQKLIEKEEVKEEKILEEKITEYLASKGIELSYYKKLGINIKFDFCYLYSPQLQGTYKGVNLFWERLTPYQGSGELSFFLD